MARSSKRKYDVVLFGATGFTGRLVAEYLAQHYGDGDLKWALAGRNRAKLERVRSEISGAGDVPIIEADSNDPASLTAMAKSTKVVCTTVGPYAKYGSELVAACVTEGTDYCDLTGETQFIRRMIDAHHAAALESGARIVHCCGFDSIPSDLGMLFLQDHAIEAHGTPAHDVTLYVWRQRGGFSGGTMASMSNVADEMRRDPSVRKILGHPYALNPEGEREGPDRGDLQTAKYDKTIGAWIGPFIMASINTRVVRRSNALLDYRYGRDLRYREVMRFGKGMRGRLAANALAAGMIAFLAGMAVPPVKSLMERYLLPSPGEGPSRAAIESGFFDIRLVTQVRGVDLRVQVKADKDPGYGATAIMLGESAVCLAKDRRALASAGSGAGILTPASAMGQVLIERLNGAGVTFEVI